MIEDELICNKNYSNLLIIYNNKGAFMDVE